MMQKRWK